MIFKKAFRFCLKPKKVQIELFKQFVGAKRFVFNRGLAQRKEAFEKEKKTLSLFDQNNELSKLKQAPNFEWLKSIHSQIPQQALGDLDRAFQNFFQGLKSKKKIGYSRFKCKGVRESFRYPQEVKVKDNLTYLPKIGWVRFRNQER